MIDGYDLRDGFNDPRLPGLAVFMAMLLLLANAVMR